MRFRCWCRAFQSVLLWYCKNISWKLLVVLYAHVDSCSTNPWTPYHWMGTTANWTTFLGRPRNREIKISKGIGNIFRENVQEKVQWQIFFIGCLCRQIHWCPVWGQTNQKKNKNLSSEALKLLTGNSDDSSAALIPDDSDVSDDANDDFASDSD